MGPGILTVSRKPKSDVSDEGGIYRPLWVLVDAVEAEIRRKLHEQAQRRIRHVDSTTQETLVVLGHLQRAHPELRHAYLHRSEQDATIALSYRCSVCHSWHSVALDERELRSSVPPADVWVRAVTALLESECPSPVELGAGRRSSGT